MKPLDLASRGLAVFPCLASKAPATPNGFLDAVTDPAAVRDLFRRYPGPLIGVATGEASGIDALDLDRARSADVWWDDHAHYVPRTYTYQTRSGGLHLWFKHDAGGRNSASLIAQDVDVRASGGYVVFWPSDGYPVVDSSPVAEWPQWLLDARKPPPPLIRTDVPRVVLEGDAARRYALGALRKAVERVATAGEGRRNDTLNAQAFSLGRFIESGELHASEIAIALAVAASHAGLTAREAERTLASALGARGAHG